MSDVPRYKRVLLKLSGEAFCQHGQAGLDPACVIHLAEQVLPVAQLGVQVAMVVGGGNFIRGRQLTGANSAGMTIQRSTADYMGMLATVINALALRDVLEARGVAVRVQSAITMTAVCEPFIPRRATRHLEKGRIVIFAAGTGNPFFTTDTGAALRAREIGAEVLLKATKVDGVFDADPVRNPNAKKYEQLTYHKVLTDQLGVMDMTAISMCMDSAMPILVFQLARPGAMMDAICGRKVGTLITAD